MKKSNGPGPSYWLFHKAANNVDLLGCFDGWKDSLKRFADKQNLHLIKLLATFYYQGHYYLVFPWADGNIFDYWTSFPDPNKPERDWRFVKWMSQQWPAVAEGLRAIHNAPNHSSILPESSTHDPRDLQVHGRHGDLEPSNILWFKSTDSQLEDYNIQGTEDTQDFGLFVISGFGLMEFHSTQTVDQVSTTGLPRSPTYRPPECDVSETISQSFDIWTLGCVLLEFAVFYTDGGDEVDEFSKRRTAEERPAPIPEDKFFKTIEKATYQRRS
ncbi:kinase-like domain-containing protein [Bombardia bombarda]|uniref:Kinase-like domain-containing protein n=1 Tax=Bombardia bombarda TaxID=252184 RepID=A0AA39TJP7_9PEZI|nr:kinase-like domain-containing protein [Bombardia bombarda]